MWRYKCEMRDTERHLKEKIFPSVVFGTKPHICPAAFHSRFSCCRVAPFCCQSCPQHQCPPNTIMPLSPWWCSCHKPPSLPPLPAPHKQTNTHSRRNPNVSFRSFFPPPHAALRVEINLWGRRLAPSYSVLILSQITRQLFSPLGPRIS